MTKKAEIGEWFDTGINCEFEFMIVVCDTFDHENYPVYCLQSEFKQKYANYNQNMQKVMEVYDLSIDKETQLNQKQCMNMPVN